MRKKRKIHEEQDKMKSREMIGREERKKKERSRERETSKEKGEERK